MYIIWDFHGRSYHCTAVGAIWNLSKFTGSTGKSLYSIFLESRSVLGAKISSAFNTSTGASKYIKIVKNHYPPIFQNFPKLCNTFKQSFCQLVHTCICVCKIACVANARLCRQTTESFKVLTVIHPVISIFCFHSFFSSFYHFPF